MNEREPSSTKPETVLNNIETQKQSQTFKLEKVQKIVESKETEDLLYCLDVLEIRAVSIGEGDSAEVFVAEGTPFEKVCLKRIKKNPRVVCNDIDEENDFQIKAQEAGVRTPLPLISLQTDRGPCFLMERIDGHSMKDIIKNPELLPKGFKYDTFFKLLEEQVSIMHKSGLYHRDLHFGNVMINKENLPVIIDFGSAVSGSGSDFTYEGEVLVYNERSHRYEQKSGTFKDDLKSISELKEQFIGFK
ncbi:MAG: phosphotransferase [Minisyncoccia bacterium]